MKIEMPDKWAFSTEVEVRVTDLNYGNHLANQQFLAYAQEARIRFFATYGFTRLTREYGVEGEVTKEHAVESP